VAEIGGLHANLEKQRHELDDTKGKFEAAEAQIGKLKHELRKTRENKGRTL
jgi:uncharacterized protein (DUF3084 family)